MRKRTLRIEDIEKFDTDQLRDYTKELEDRAYTAGTWRVYKHSWKQFKKWCEMAEVAHLPAEVETIQNFLSWMVQEKYSNSSIQRTIHAIAKFHDLAEELSPTKHIQIKKQIAGIQRTIGTTSKSKKNLTLVELATICQIAPDKPIWTRNKSILTLGFAGALRRSEVANLKVEDVEFKNNGAILNIYGAKTAKKGEVQRVGVPMGKNELICPVRNLKNWLAFTKMTEGPLYLPMKPPLGNEIWKDEPIFKETVSQVVKRGVELLDYDSSLYGGHSLRRGMITAASQARIPLARIKQHSRHKSLRTLLLYIEDSELFEDNPASLIGF